MRARKCNKDVAFWKTVHASLSFPTATMAIKSPDNDHVQDYSVQRILISLSAYELLKNQSVSL